MYHVYVLQNPNGKFYVGQTDNLESRVQQHNDPSADTSKYCPKNGPWTLVWSEAHETRAAAMERESQIKSMKSARCIRENFLSQSQLVEQVPARRESPSRGSFFYFSNNEKSVTKDGR
jgi:putative endonuclease